MKPRSSKTSMASLAPSNTLASRNSDSAHSDPIAPITRPPGVRESTINASVEQENQYLSIAYGNGRRQNLYHDTACGRCFPANRLRDLAVSSKIDRGLACAKASRFARNSRRAQQKRVQNRAAASPSAALNGREGRIRSSPAAIRRARAFVDIRRLKAVPQNQRPGVVATEARDHRGDVVHAIGRLGTAALRSRRGARIPDRFGRGAGGQYRAICGDLSDGPPRPPRADPSG